MSAREFPDVHGGWLAECAGGPLDGELVFVPFASDEVPVWYFHDGQRTPTTHPVGHLYAENYMGAYWVNMAAHKPRVLRWHEWIGWDAWHAEQGVGPGGGCPVTPALRARAALALIPDELPESFDYERFGREVFAAHRKLRVMLQVRGEALEQDGAP